LIAFAFSHSLDLGNLQKAIEWKRQRHTRPAIFSQPRVSGQLNPARLLVDVFGRGWARPATFAAVSVHRGGARFAFGWKGDLFDYPVTRMAPSRRACPILGGLHHQYGRT